MKKTLLVILALAMCVSLLSVAAFAAQYSYVSVTGTMNEWNPAAESGKMTETSAGVYTITFADMAAGEHQFKFTANGNWSDLDLGGAFMGSGIEGSLNWGGSNIVFTVEEVCNVTIVLDLTAFDGSNGAKFTVTVGEKVDAPAGKIKIHISVPEDWGDVYAYVWNPEHLGSWSGTKVENGVVEVTAVFDGMVINNGNGRQSWDIKDIDLTKEEVWITVNADGSYSLAYEAPVEDEPEAPAVDILVNIIAPADWAEVYAYVWNPELLGGWGGTKVENGQIAIHAAFEGMVIHNGNGVQSWDIKDIDLTKEEVWITVNADGSYALAYEAPAEEDPEPPVPDARPIKIHVIAEHWNAVYAYTFNPELNGSWPGALVENGVIEILNVFEGLVLNNGEGQQTADIKDIDLTKEEVWITVNADGSYTLAYEAPAGDDVKPIVPDTGDDVVVVFVVMMMSAACAVTLLGKKKYI